MTPILLESRVDEVRVFRSGALVRRVATLPPFEGPEARVRFADLPVSLDDTTLRLECDGAGAVLLDAAIALDGADRTATQGSSDEREHEALVREEAALIAKIAGLDAAASALEQAHVPDRPSGAEGEPPPDVDVDAALSFVSFKRERWEGLMKRRREPEREHAHATERRRVIAHRLEQSRSSRLPQPDELRKSVVATARREGAAAGGARVALEYFVPGARWAPAYVLRVDTPRRRATLELRAIVAQSSGEDWRDVQLSLSTAEAMRFHELPELQSLRLGRAQAAPRKRTWRAPPRDPSELFADFARAAPQPSPRPPREAPPEPEPVRDFFAEAEEDRGRPTPQMPMAAARDEPMMPMGMPLPMQPQSMGAPKGGFMAGLLGMGPPPGAAPSAPMASAPMPSASPARGGGAPVMKARKVAAEVARAHDAPAAAEAEAELELDPSLLVYEGLRMPAFDQRVGKLRPASLEERYLELSRTLDGQPATQVRKLMIVRVAAARKAATAALPALHTAPEALEGFDYAHTCAARVDVPADGEFHSLPVGSFESQLALRHVAVPRESRDVFRFVELDNPLDAPLLRGPCDVYFDRDFLVTIELATVPPRGKLRAGLGVDQAIKCARNTSFSEATSGLMSGTLALKHTLQIELANHRADAADVEVRERVPYVPEREDDIKLEVTAQPSWRPWEPPLGEAPVKGAYAWRVAVEPGGRAELIATYVVKIPSKLELVGGNRRD